MPSYFHFDGCVPDFYPGQVDAGLTLLEGTSLLCLICLPWMSPAVPLASSASNLSLESYDPEKQIALSIECPAQSDRQLGLQPSPL